MNTEYTFWSIIPRKEPYVSHEIEQITLHSITIANKVAIKNIGRILYD